jgi:hypothetical protein
MKFYAFSLFALISLSYAATATNPAPGHAQYPEQFALLKAFKEKDARTALDLAHHADDLQQITHAPAILFVVLAAIEYEEFKKLYSQDYFLTQGANRLKEAQARIGIGLGDMLHDLITYSDGEKLRKRAIEYLVFIDLNALSIFTIMLQTGQFPKLTASFFDDMDMLKKFVSADNYHFLNLAGAKFLGDIETSLSDTDPEVNKRNFIAIAYHCARALNKEAAAKFLEGHL